MNTKGVIAMPGRKGIAALPIGGCVGEALVLLQARSMPGDVAVHHLPQNLKVGQEMMEDASCLEY
jgi:hypothetical protein